MYKNFQVGKATDILPSMHFNRRYEKINDNKPKKSTPEDRGR